MTDRNSNPRDQLSFIDREVDLLKDRISAIEKRNVSVERDKAWETSNFRVVVVTAATYAVCSIVFYVIGAKDFWLSAIIPALAYYLSTQSLPLLKRYWEGRHKP